MQSQQSNNNNNNNNTSTRLRNRMGIFVVASLAATLPSVSGLAASTRAAPASAATVLAPPPKVGVAPPNPLEYYEGRHAYHYEESEESDEEFLSLSNNVQRLQRSMGSEILDRDLQRQVDAGPERFLDAHVADASYLEKVAMSSIPEQLPRAAVKALSRSSSNNDRQTNTKKMSRMSHAEELELGRKIQRGVALHQQKTDFEAQHGRDITRAEWTELAGLESSNELRRQVSEYRRAKQMLVSANLGLVRAVVHKNYGSIRRTTGLNKEELIQEGSLGLMRAAELFDPARGLRFSTYATIWIKGTLQNSHVTDGSITLPQREKTKWNKIVKAHQELTKIKSSSASSEHAEAAAVASDAPEPTIEEIAHHLGMKVSEVLSTKRKMSQAQQVLSLDYEYATSTRSGSDAGNMKLLENDKSFQEDADLAERTQLHADVVAAMARNLDAREARLMRLRYGLADGQTRSLSACAEAMGLSQTRVQQLAQQCLKKLRRAAEMESLEEYLLTVA